MLQPDAVNLVACSGGADSLALAATAAWHHQRSSGVHSQTEVGAVVVDHGLHPESAQVSATAAQQLADLGLHPVLTIPVTVDTSAAGGPEAAARAARYQAFAQAMAETGATRILLGHTADDQAEQVLLGLARGSGTRSLAGIPPVRGPFHRPLLGVTREQTEAICRHAGLQWWEDPTNADPALLRSRIRTQIMPFLNEHLSTGIRESLTRTAEIAAADAEYLEARAKEVFPQVLEDPDPSGTLRLRLKAVKAEPPAIRRRVLALAIAATGGTNPSFERLSAVESLLSGSRSAGPVQLEGGVSAYRGTRGSAEYGKLVLVPPS